MCRKLERLPHQLFLFFTVVVFNLKVLILHEVASQQLLRSAPPDFLFFFLNSLYLSLLAFYGEIDSGTVSGFMAGIN